MGLTSGQPVVNPKNGNRNGVDLDLVVTSTAELIPMIEAGANQVPEDLVISALEMGHQQNVEIVKFISEFAAQVAPTKIILSRPEIPADLRTKVNQVAKDIIKSAVTHASGRSYLDREAEYELAKSQIYDQFDPKEKDLVKLVMEDLFTQAFRTQILKGTRADGRKIDEIRPLTIEAGVLPRVHGSAIFQRGETQVLTITTLGSPSLSQSLESAEGEDTKRYMHHYNMPKFASGEIGKIGSPGRREIGHGALAERALAPVIPPESEFPYAIRVVSEVMTSNGSTSMASTCGSTLSLMDAGVPLKSPVAGISTGLITGENYPKDPKDYVLITDINGGEDHYGDMDFKVAGTATGVTAIQLDVKITGLTLEICRQTFARARTARDQIMSSMLKVIPTHRPQLSPFAPQISTAQIPVDKIGELIGPSGRNIKKLMAETETTIDVNDAGQVFITGTNSDSVTRALNYVSGLGKEVVVGEIYEGVVARIQPFGAFVNILPGKDGLVHVSQMAEGYVSDPTQVVHEGQPVKVWVTEIDSQGRVNLSMLFDASGNPIAKAREERPAPRRPFDSGGRRDNFRGPRPLDRRRRF
jgi:polyribonucleotide nucleotidyltransferase